MPIIDEIRRLHSLRSESMLMRVHVHSPPAKAHAFRFQSKALFEGRITAQLDFSARAEHALPRQTIGSAQDSRNLASVPGKAGGFGNRAVGRNFTARDLQNGRANARFGGDRSLLLLSCRQAYAAAPLRNDCTASSSLL
jgi:hypothetical protein